MLILAEFEFELGSNANIIYESLIPELNQDYQRTRATLYLEHHKLILKITAQDIISMRAALNGWLRLIRIAEEMCFI